MSPGDVPRPPPHGPHSGLHSYPIFLHRSNSRSKWFWPTWPLLHVPAHLQFHFHMCNFLSPPTSPGGSPCPQSQKWSPRLVPGSEFWDTNGYCLLCRVPLQCHLHPAALSLLSVLDTLTWHTQQHFRSRAVAGLYLLLSLHSE